MRKLFLKVQPTFVGKYHPFDAAQCTVRKTGYVAVWGNMHGNVYRSKRCTDEFEAARLAYRYFDKHFSGKWIDGTSGVYAWIRTPKEAQ